ncbi:hypothetical protein HYW21_04950 [Candidatus Woesearchaeota archaeon]|nr:hypothetical protein [Candidatus Woesearchaeota archaeon]
MPWFEKKEELRKNTLFNGQYSLLSRIKESFLDQLLFILGLVAFILGYVFDSVALIVLGSIFFLLFVLFLWIHFRHLPHADQSVSTGSLQPLPSSFPDKLAAKSSSEKVFSGHAPLSPSKFDELHQTTTLSFLKTYGNRVKVTDEEEQRLVQRVYLLLEREQELKNIRSELEHEEHALKTEIELVYDDFLFLTGLPSALEQHAPEHTLADDVKKVLTMVDELLEKLPEHEIRQFVASEDFAVYQRLMENIKQESTKEYSKGQNKEPII